MKNTNPPPSQFFKSSVLNIKPSKTPKMAIATPKANKPYSKSSLVVLSRFSRSSFITQVRNIGFLRLFRDEQSASNGEKDKIVYYCPRCNIEISIAVTHCPKCKGKIIKSTERELYYEENI